MNNFFKTFFACLAAVFAGGLLLWAISFIFFIGIVAALSSDEKVAVTHGSVLQINLTETIKDNPTLNPLNALNPYAFNRNRQLALLDVLNAIERAADDDKIEGIYLNLSPYLSMGMGTMEEIRDALYEFKQTGKFLLAYSEYYTQRSYYLASVADEVYVHPEGNVDWYGLASQVMFFKGTLDKLEIEPEIYRVGEFKSAVEPYFLDGMSPENRLQLEVLTGTLWGHMVGEVARSREIDSARLQQYASELTITGPLAAVGANLVNDVAYPDHIMTRLMTYTYADNEDEMNFVTLSDYIKSPTKRGKRAFRSKNRVSVIYAEGDIISGGPAEGSIDGHTLAAKLAAARQDDKIKAVVLRVNSPGGSALASDIIWREMVLLQQKKPLVVSMGDYAASGGYYISAPADIIIADKSTLTGSIGVFGMTFNMEQTFKNKLGITVDVAKTNPSADMMTVFRAHTPAEQAFIQNSVENVYETFVDHVAKGRNLSHEQVKNIGGGRVWSGISAREIGLIDGYGGIKNAIEIAANRAGLGDNYRVVTPEDDKDQLSMLLDILFNGKVSSLEPWEQQLLNEYHAIKRIMEDPGVQARLPCAIEIN